MVEITIPIGLRRNCWTPNWMLNGIVQTLPANKMYGLTVTNADATYQQHWDFGISHMQDLVDDKWGATKPLSKRWGNYRSTGHSTPESFANAQPLDKNHGYGGQLKEDGFTDAQAIEGFGRIYDRLAASDSSIQSPADTWVIGDYFVGLPGGFLVTSKGNSTHMQRHREGLATKEMCRMQWNFGDKIFNQTHIFYDNFWGYNKQNGLLPAGYLNSWVEIRHGGHAFGLIYDIQKSRGGCTGRRLVAFEYSSYDLAAWAYLRQKMGLKFTSPAGTLYRKAEWEPLPWEIAKQRQFFYLLLADGAMWWETAHLYTNDVSKWWTGLDNENDWHPEGGSRVAYDQNNGTHPAKINDPSPTLIRQPLGISENGVATGTYIFARLYQLGLVGEWVEWAPFSYSLDGGSTQSGYMSGNNPLNGLNGNARLSNFLTPNYNEYNVVDSFEAEKPILLRTKGVNGFAYVALNSFADPDQTTVITLTANGNQTLTLKGDEMSVFY